MEISEIRAKYKLSLSEEKNDSPRHTEPKLANEGGPKRYERKFAVNGLDSFELEFLLKTNPALFISIYEPRFINNIYLDTPDLRFYHENLAGIADRFKVRIRWYGQEEGIILQPRLELKIKNGLVGWKESYQLKTLDRNDVLNRRALISVCEYSGLPFSVLNLLKSLEPTLQNRYKRSYYLSGCTNFRATLDSKLSYSRLSGIYRVPTHTINDTGLHIIELKYAPENNPQVSKITNSFPFRLSRNSKYVRGLSLT